MISADSGSQTATIDTEHVLATETTGGVYTLVVDLSNLANGDVVVLKLKSKVLSTSSAALRVWSQSFAHAQADPVKQSPPVAVTDEVSATLEQTDGTGRSFDWNLLRLN